MENQLSLEPSKTLSDFNQLIQFANYLCKSEALPATYKNSANVLVALQTGKEMGLEPMQSLRMLYIVNGNIKPWGTAYPYFLKKAGYQIKIGKHDKEICEVTVTKDNEIYTYEATKDDVKKDSKAMGFAPKEKLYFHACARIINYYLPEIMSGMNFDNQIEDFSLNAVEVKTEVLSQKSELQKFIENEVQNLESLKSVHSQLKTEAEKEAYSKKLEEFEKAEGDKKPESQEIIVEQAKKPTTEQFEALEEILENFAEVSNENISTIRDGILEVYNLENLREMDLDTYKELSKGFSAKIKKANK